MAVAETSLVQKEPPNFNDHQPENHSKINREVSMTAITETLSVRSLLRQSSVN